MLVKAKLRIYEFCMFWRLFIIILYLYIKRHEVLKNTQLDIEVNCNKYYLELIVSGFFILIL